MSEFKEANLPSFTSLSDFSRVSPYRNIKLSNYVNREEEEYQSIAYIKKMLYESPKKTKEIAERKKEFEAEVKKIRALKAKRSAIKLFKIMLIVSVSYIILVLLLL